MRAKVVIGAAFGDEGKGMAVDVLSSAAKTPMVVRFNGGCQAGHTVQTPAGNRHVFRHVGAGALSGAPTFLSRHFLVNPAIFLREMHDLSRLIECPKVFVDPRAHVTTPYDIMLNRWREEDRGLGRHGSCGEGIGETVERGLAGVYIEARELFGEPSLLERKLYDVADYAMERAANLNIRLNTERADMIRGKKAPSSFMAAAGLLRGKMNLGNVEMLSAYEVIFEGAQGLLLDQDNDAMFPHLTRSNTGLTNVIDICGEAGIVEADVYYMLRPYLTRHGAGPLPNEGSVARYADVVDLTNMPNAWQGDLRFAPLDLDTILNGISKDIGRIADGQMFGEAMIGLSCLDQIRGPVDFYADNIHQIAFPTELLPDLTKFLGLRVGFESWGPTRSTAKLKSRVAA